ncbi:DUF1992 domain-containing protein [Prescottella agglutinans]|uniref:DUF1992 domain-containing protein n=1 Tax=Prescottella agglutinans TaxID=1644129 RepID=A0A438BFC8_9NOCA|nr:DUF1992 domain-containing protein [Prescottella agglutinans]RVW09743.1 DUF1992 domain-containing protein [Prescottella agglutinans]
MTERKPLRATFESWVETQIRGAYERGEFENLDGAGKPIPAGGGDDWWVRGYLRREGLSADDLLPEPLRLRKDIERLPEVVRTARSEREVRDEVARINRRIAVWLRNPSGPQVPVRRVDADEVVDQWRAGRAAAPAGDVGVVDEEQRRARRAQASAALAEAGYAEIRRGKARFGHRRRLAWPFRRRRSDA